MLSITMQPVPSQIVKAAIAGQNFQILLQQKQTGLFADVAVNGVDVVTGVIVRDIVPIISRTYFGVAGNLVIVDTQGADDPYYSGLGSRWQLAYLTDAEIAEIEATRFPAARDVVYISTSSAGADTTPPTVTGGQSFSYNENRSEGYAVGTVAATDNVGIASFRFSATGTGTSADGYFAISSAGQITLTTAGAAVGSPANDYETPPNSFTYGVQAGDAAGNWSAAVNITISVLDVTETVATVAVLAIIGQSNAVGWNAGAGPTPSDATIPSNLYQWSQGASAETAVSALPFNFNSYNSANTTASIKLSPALYVAQALCGTYSKVIIVPSATGGTQLTGSGSTAYWTKPNEGYSDTVTALNAIKALYPTADVYYQWGQGESDSLNMVSNATYKSAFISMLSNLRADVTGAATAPILIGSMVPSWIAGAGSASGATAVAIDQAHREIPLAVDNAMYAVGPTGTPVDPIHYDQAMARTLGQRLAVILGKVKILTAAVPSAPTGLTAVSSTVISFVTPSTMAHAYQIETQPSGGGSWTATTYYPPAWLAPGDTATVTLSSPPAGGSVRVAAVGRAGLSAYSSTVTLGSGSSSNPHQSASLPTPTIRLKFAAATTSGSNITAVPSDGTVTTAWTAPTGKEPQVATSGGVPLVSCVTTSQRLIGPTMPTGSYTKFIRAKLTAAPAVGHLSSEASSCLYFSGTLYPRASHNLGADLAISPTAVTVGTIFDVAEVYDSAAGTLKTYFNGTLAATSTSVTAPTGQDKMALNTLVWTSSGYATGVDSFGCAADYVLFEIDSRAWSSTEVATRHTEAVAYL